MGDGSPEVLKLDPPALVCLPAKPAGYSTVVSEPGDLLESEESRTFASVGPHTPMESAIGIF